MSPIVINLAVVAFVLATGYIWFIYGLFSALLHLIVVVCAGSLAFALWEPLTLGLIMGQNMHLAWGVGLLLPFGVVLILGRVGIDKAVPDNIKFPQLIDSLGGGACGVLSGVLTAGLLLIGGGFLPFGPNLMGYQPYIVQADGTVGENPDSSLWVPVDAMAAGFFNWASVGGFNASKPLKQYRPELARQAAVVRLAKSYDPNMNLYAAPENVSLGQFHTMDRAVVEQIAELDPGVAEDLAAVSGTGPFVVAETLWNLEPEGAFDNDGILRVPPVQVRLLSFNDDGGDPVLHAPFAWVGRTSSTGDPHYHPIEDNISMPYGFETSDVPVRWVFTVGDDREPAFLVARQLRLPVAEDEVTQNHGPAFAEALTTFAPEVVERRAGGGEDQPVAERGDGPLGGAIRVTTELPDSFDVNKVPGANTVDGDREKLLVSGDFTVTDTRARSGARTTVSAFDLNTQFRMVRLRVSSQLPMSLWRAVRSPVPGPGVYFTDDDGDRIFPFASVVVRGNETMEIDANRNFAPMERSDDLPLNTLSPQDSLYLYFRTTPGTTLETLHVGDQAEREVGFAVD